MSSFVKAHIIKMLLILSISIQLISCATSTATREAPGLTLDVLNVASGNLLGPSYSDHKSQITVNSYIPIELSCFSILNNLIVEVRGPSPSDSIVSTTSFDKSGKATIISEASPGVYSLNLLNTRSNEIISSIEFHSSKLSDRFNFYFKKCK